MPEYLPDMAAQLVRAPAEGIPDAAPDAPVMDASSGPAGRGQGTSRRGEAPPHEDDRAAPPGRDKPPRPRGEIWDGCPVRPLGLNGEMSYYLDRHGQLRGVDNHTQQKILHLFGDRIDSLIRQFPNVGKEGVRRHDRFDQTAASMTMIAACSEKGLFNPDGAVRGVGAWRDDDGALVYHCGDTVMTAEGCGEPRDFHGKIYPAYPPIPAPADPGQTGDPAPDILSTLERWNWMRRDVEPMLALGMIGVQMLGGALDWRPVYWLTGDKASGKSTFQDMLKHLHGDKGLIQSNDPTKSGITSRLGHSSLPVAIDELEPGDEGSGKERDIIILARVAASGGQWLRGSSDQKGASGNVYSAFLFSSILIPGAMKPQDRSRLITLQLATLDPDAPRMSLDPRTWRKRGAALKRLLIDRWPTWADRLSLWREALALQGIGGRNGDNYATTLAMADMALHEALPSPEALEGWASSIARATRADTEDIGSDAEDMIVHLLGQPLDVYRRGELFTVAQWVQVAACLPAAPRQLIVSAEAITPPTDDERRNAAKDANTKLAKYGLRVKGEGRDAELFIANKPIPELSKLFARSTWAGGVWAQSARRLPGATLTNLRLAGLGLRGVYVPLGDMLGISSFPMDRSPPGPTRAPLPDDLEDFI